MKNTETVHKESMTQNPNLDIVIRTANYNRKTIASQYVINNLKIIKKIANNNK